MVIHDGYEDHFLIVQAASFPTLDGGDQARRRDCSERRFSCGISAPQHARTRWSSWSRAGRTCHEPRLVSACAAESSGEAGSLRDSPWSTSKLPRDQALMRSAGHVRIMLPLPHQGLIVAVMMTVPCSLTCRSLHSLWAPPSHCHWLLPVHAMRNKWWSKIT